jgi:hypothetical protein
VVKIYWHTPWRTPKPLHFLFVLIWPQRNGGKKWKWPDFAEIWSNIFFNPRAQVLYPSYSPIIHHPSPFKFDLLPPVGMWESEFDTKEALLVIILYSQHFFRKLLSTILDIEKIMNKLGWAEPHSWFPLNFPYKIWVLVLDHLKA